MKKVTVSLYLGGFFWDVDPSGNMVYTRTPWIKVTSILELEAQEELTPENMRVNPQLVQRWKVKPSVIALPVNKAGDLSLKEVKTLYVAKSLNGFFRRMYLSYRSKKNQSPVELNSKYYGMLNGCCVFVDWSPSAEKLELVAKEMEERKIVLEAKETKGKKNKSKVENVDSST